LPEPGRRQEAFLPIEVILSYGLFFVMDPHSFGGANMARAPEHVRTLALAFRRPASSINYKMLNLDGSQKNCGRLEPELFAALGAQPDRFVHLYQVIIASARNMGLGESAVPDFLEMPSLDHRHLLLGQDELGSTELAVAFEELAGNMAMLESSVGLGERETSRIVEQRIRMGQHRFAKQVLDNFQHTCVFCGFAPRHLCGRGLLLASHIKPWRDSDNRERLDPANGLAACPVHDKAFDSGLLMINGGLRIHRSESLVESIGADDRSADYFGDRSLAPTLILVPGALPPDRRYLDYHREHVFEQRAATGGAA
jgi:putative restriction endonuclease